jgi:hypothetical protein
MGIKGTTGIAILALALLLSNSALAAAGKPGPKLSVAQSQQDSSQKPADQDKPAPSGQEQPAQDQPARNKPEQKPETQQPPEEKPNPAEPTTTPPAKPAPAQSEPGSSGSPAGTTATNPEAPAGTPEPQPGANTETPPASTPNSKSASSPTGLRRRNGQINSRKKIVVREGGTAEANALLAPSMTLEQASRQRENTLHMLATAETNLQKISARQLNTNQQAMVGQARAYMLQAKEALKRGDLQRSHNLALKASLLSDDLARH